MRLGEMWNEVLHSEPSAGWSPRGSPRRASPGRVRRLRGRRGCGGGNAALHPPRMSAQGTHCTQTGTGLKITLLISDFAL